MLMEEGKSEWKDAQGKGDRVFLLRAGSSGLPDIESSWT